MSVDLEQLKEYSLFGGLLPGSIAILRDLMRKESFQAGDLIFTAGSDGDEICFITEGKVAIRSGEVVIARIGEGEHFGEMHIIDIMPRSADVIAECDGCFLALHHRDIFQFRKKDAAGFSMLMMNCARDVSRRLRVMNGRYTQLKNQMEELKSKGNP